MNTNDQTSTKGASAYTLRGGCGLGLALTAGNTVEIVNTHGTQVVDLWAVLSQQEYLSIEHSREVIPTVRFHEGDTLLTNIYRPILTFEKDTSPKTHDTLIAACNPEMYLRAGRSRSHPNCADNFARAIKKHGITMQHTPCPWNLFMFTEVGPDGSIRLDRPELCPGGAVVLRMESDCVLVLSACPDDVYPTNGGDGQAKDVSVNVRP